MIVHDVGADTIIDYDWDDADGVNIPVVSAVLLIDGEPASDLLTINGTYAVTLRIPDDSEIAPGNHQYMLTADDGETVTVLSAGLLRVRDLA